LPSVFADGADADGLAGQFIAVFMQSHWVLVIATVQVIGGALLLVGRYVPLALALLGPSDCKHPDVSSADESCWNRSRSAGHDLWLFLFYRYRANFAGLFVAKAE